MARKPPVLKDRGPSSGRGASRFRKREFRLFPYLKEEMIAFVRRGRSGQIQMEESTTCSYHELLIGMRRLTPSGHNCLKSPQG